MKSILVVNSSLADPSSSTRRVVAALVARLRAQHPAAVVIDRDLFTHPTPHYQPGSTTLAQELCQELIACDAIIVGAPMWNFSVPSVLKAWIDHLVLADVTFRYTASGPKGLLAPGKKLYLVEASGGVYSSAPASELNHVGPYLAQIFRFLGVSKIETISIEGTAMRREMAEQQALRRIEIEAGV